MNEFELSKNVQLEEYRVKDLNVDPTFPFEDGSFDVVTCVVSVDYLNKPLEVCDSCKQRALVFSRGQRVCSVLGIERTSRLSVRAFRRGRLGFLVFWISGSLISLRASRLVVKAGLARRGCSAKELRDRIDCPACAGRPSERLATNVWPTLPLLYPPEGA